jgi:hypothetical protein
MHAVRPWSAAWTRCGGRVAVNIARPWTLTASGLASISQSVQRVDLREASRSVEHQIHGCGCLRRGGWSRRPPLPSPLPDTRRRMVAIWAASHSTTTPPPHPRSVLPCKRRRGMLALPSSSSSSSSSSSPSPATPPARWERERKHRGSRGSSTSTAPRWCTLSCSSHPHMPWVTGPHPTLSPPAVGSSPAAIRAWMIPRYTASMN